MSSDAKSTEGGRDTCFELPKSIELFKDALLEILEVEGQASLTNSVAFTDRFVAFPAADSSTFQFDELLHKSFLGRAILFCMHGDWKNLISNLVGFDEGLKVHTALILIKPILAIELQIGTSVVDFPSIVEPARAPEYFFKVLKYLLHLSWSCSPFLSLREPEMKSHGSTRIY